MFQVDALEAFGISIDVNCVWEDTVKCNLSLQITYNVEYDTWASGCVSMPGMCFNRKTLHQLCTSIDAWREQHTASPCAFIGTFDLTVFGTEKTILAFTPYMDGEEKTRGKLSFSVSNFIGDYAFIVDPFALSTFSTQFGRIIGKTGL